MSSRTSEAKIGANPEWELAKFAIICWIDELLSNLDWPGREWWLNNTLEFLLFRGRDRATDFYRRAEETSAFQKRDGLEVFYLCVILGFRGLYQDLNSEPMEAARLDLPPTLTKWIDQTASSLRQRAKPRLSPTGKPGPGVPILEGQTTMIKYFLLASVLAACTVVAAWMYFQAP